MIYTIITWMFNPEIAMNNKSIDKLISRLHDLTVQHMHAQEALEEIILESAHVKHRL